MRIAYLVHFRGGGESGILRKVASQSTAWGKLGSEVGLFVATAPDSAAAWEALPEAVAVQTPPSGPLSLLREREALIRKVDAWQPDVVYLRHGLVHPGLIGLARRRPCVIEVNGDDLTEARLTSTPRYLLAKSTRGLLLRRAAGLVFVTRELGAKPSFAAYQRPSIVVGNGIDLSSVEQTPAPANQEPRLIFVGHPHTPWHGLDRLARLARAQPTWHFDVVGPAASELVDATPNVQVRGTLKPQDYAPLVARSDVAIGTLGLYRKNMDEASSLKVREYLAAGLPVIIGHQDTDFPEGAGFLLQVPNQPDSLSSSMEAIESFVRMWHGQRVPREAVKHLDVAVKEGSRLAFMQEVADA